VNLHFHTMDDLREAISDLGDILARPTRHLSHPTLYRRRDVGKNEKIIKGIRVKDWLLSDDQRWALPHDQMGLSFSSNYKNLKKVYKLKERHNPGSATHVFWVLEEADLPSGLKFEADRDKKGHYFLTVTEPILLEKLVEKLRAVAQRMSIIQNAGRLL